MNTLFTQYEIAKKNSIDFMKNGQINAYMNSLIKINKYKRLMLVVVSN
ncbi:MAG: hypothetical protein ACJA17_000313 [Polaribacter sp.]|jgi:hypothetical protein